MKELKDTLRSVGCTMKYRGYIQLLDAILLVIEDNERLFDATKSIYRAVAAKHGCSAESVERNIRTIVNHAWMINPAEIERIAGFPLKDKPSAIEFIEIMAAFILRQME